MALEDELNKIDQEYAKMQLDSELRYSDDANELYSDGGIGWVSYNDLLRLLLETYQKAIEIGWETKALESLATKIRTCK